MADIKRLVFSIIEFFDDQIVSGDLSEDALESLEVAKQCLETAYGLNLSQDTQYRVSRSLLDVFNSSVGRTEGIPTPVPTREATKEEKDEAEKLKTVGNELMKSEQYNEAVDYYSKAITLDGRNAVFYSNRAAAYSKLNEHEKAIEDCKMAIPIDPKYSKAYGRMGLAYASLSDFTSAKDCYLKASALDPTNDSYKQNLATAEERLSEGSRSAAGAGPSLGGMPGGAGMPPGGVPGMPGLGNFDLAGLMSNPSVMNMAQNIMSSPEMSSMLANMMSGAGGGGGGAGNQGAQGGQAGADQPPAMDNLLRTTFQLAQQMQNQNPELVQQLRRNLGDQDPNQQNPDNQDQQGNNGGGPTS